MDAKGNPYFDGPSYYWKIANYVDPDNGHLVKNVRRKLRNLTVKDHGHSVINMLAEFKNLKQKVAELGGTHDEDDHKSEPIDIYMRGFTQKEVAMKADGEWNVLSQEDAIIMALVNVLVHKVQKGQRPVGTS